MNSSSVQKSSTKMRITDMLEFNLVGRKGTGKSSILQRYINHTFTSSYTPSIGMDFNVTNVEMLGRSCKLLIWEITDIVQRSEFSTSYGRAAQGYLIIFNISDQASFESVESYYQHYASEYAKIILIGCFSDLSQCRKVTFEEAADKARSLSIPYIEVSAATGYNIEEAFSFLIRSKLVANIAKLKN